MGPNSGSVPLSYEQQRQIFRRYTREQDTVEMCFGWYGTTPINLLALAVVAAAMA
ncbi:hypothetical protein TWF173_004708 [Orbilia oligospora]|nr:hypothetical protein TWF173_004708 [Orbilia oligospora]